MKKLHGEEESGRFTMNGALDTNIYTFTLDAHEKTLMEEMKLELENTIEHTLSRLSKLYRTYLLDFLYQHSYDHESREFTNPFNGGILKAFVNDAQQMLASLKAFQAAFNGNESDVKDFLKRFPTMKDRPGLHNTTLLYSAARNNHINLVRYLVLRARCSVNAQNQQHIKRALSKSVRDDPDFVATPSAGSTALHGACFGGLLEMVKFLFEHGADCFLRNHADETPIDNGRTKPDIIKYFTENLILGYSIKTEELPHIPIREEDQDYVVDCVWEYKPFKEQNWFPFSAPESETLQGSLIVKPEQEFKREIHLRVRAGTYAVSLIQFLRSGKDASFTQKIAWIRCRGSSILNFNCYCLWQIMFTKYPQADTEPSLTMLTIPTAYNSNFKVHLDSWYFCDAKTSAHLDHTMKYRRKYIRLVLSHVCQDELTFNLQTFSFKNDNGSVTGCLRWIPKMISNNSRNKNKIIGIDDFQTLANLDPIPLTTARLMKVLQKDDSMSIANDDDLLGDEEEYDSDMETGDIEDNGDKYKAMNEAPTTPINQSWSIQDLADGTRDPQLNSVSSSQSDASDDLDDKRMNDFINEAAAQVRSPQQNRLDEKVTSDTLDDKNSAAAKAQLLELEKKNDKLQQDLQKEQQRIEQLLDSGSKHEQEVMSLLDQIAEMEQQQKENKRQQDKLKEMNKSIKTVDYNNIQHDVIHRFLTPKDSIIISYLQGLVKNPDPSFNDRVPKIIFAEQNNQYIVTVVGFSAHHQGFKDVLQRILSLMNVVESAKGFYQRNVNRQIKKLMKEGVFRVTSKTHGWKEYVKAFSQLLKTSSVEYGKKFQDYLDEQTNALIDQCIVGKLLTPWVEIRKATDQFLQKHSLMNEIESIKHAALEEFIKENIFIQRTKLEKKPSDESVAVLQHFVNKVKNEFKTQPIYRGAELKHFALIPKLLQRLVLYYGCFKVELPLYESSRDLLDKIEKNAVTTISTSTGSGKSTLLPVLLVAEGYDKVLVTQPRRLPCQLICKRVNETMSDESGSMKDPLAGWAISGTERNPNANILYLTDGLLKERLLYDLNLITTNTKFNKSVVFFIDEVHERSVNIDLCLSLLARLLSTQPELKTKMKVIISSATLDAAVPTLFRNIPQINLAEFKMPNMGTLHKVTEIARPNENALDIVQELCKKRKRHDQILCFVSSVGEVNQSCKLINQISRETIVAYPLIQSQHPNVQQYNIEHGTVFFSTTVAETSLTFPCLKYVVDTGMINVPVYDFDLKRTVLREVRAAQSTIKQRLGRLGRTQPGEYYSLYDFKVDAVPYPIPQICQSDLMNIEFSLRKSPLKKGFNYMKSFLPNKPSQKAIDTVTEQLKDLDILEKGSNDKLTKHGEDLAKLPDFGSLAMSKAVLAALCIHNCGRDLICLSAILGVLNTTALLKSLPQHLKSPDGDFMTLLKVMDEILLVRQSIPANQFNLDQVCQSKGLKEIQHIIRQALRRYQTLEVTFKQSPDFCARAQIQSGDWEVVARSLLAGYSDNVFVSMKELQDRSHLFVRYNNRGDIAKLDLQSTLTRPISTAPVSLVLARDIRHSTAVRATAIISFVGEIKAEWLEYLLERELDLSNEEETYLNTANRYSTAHAKFSNRINMSLGSQKMKFKGSSGIVLDAELHLRQQMISELKFNLSNTPNPGDDSNFTRNLVLILKMTNIFNPMKWRWIAERQVEITINSNTATKTCEIIVKGRDSDNKKVKREFDVFIGWLRNCAVIRHPNDYVSPRVLRPAMRKDCRDIEERISRVTDTKRTPVDLYKGVRGSQATRETRMEVVAWIAICKFDCKLEGGFVRDWIVGHYTARIPGVTDPKTWIDTSGPMPALKKEIVPCDLDCHLSSHMYFDIEKFQDELYKYGITCKVVRDYWRYVLLFDENEPTGPFTMDLIEPHVALTHDRIDLDVNNLSLEKDYTHELGMRINIQRKPYEIELEKIVSNIKNKRFKVLRPLDQYVKQRIEKMEQRGWTQDLPAISVIPDPHSKYYAILVPLPPTATLYLDVSTKMKNSIPAAQIISIEEIRNPYLEETYEGMKKLIAKQCSNQNPNEQELFHGTKINGIKGITEDGFDDRYFNKSGLYGHGAYFADDPNKSHGYTEINTVDNTRVMFFNKVVLGKPTTLTATDNTLVSAPQGTHSVIGKHAAMTEYIVYRYGQALPYLKIVYKA
ncbi:unnamed protein product [Adineta steineri]|uniref:Poly [ADP-ribose] polymerase n=1 Tax=Adineta steineri TaxID=433720 RepID=A0A815INK9_9BILA|nr:unnamed protein product [Adineta steineri]CAF3684298.1 unnamed protein product [Adineta steineri]